MSRFSKAMRNTSPTMVSASSGTPAGAQEVAMQDGRMTVEDGGEPHRLSQRRGDDGGIGPVLHDGIFPAAGPRFSDEFDVLDRGSDPRGIGGRPRVRWFCQLR